MGFCRTFIVALVAVFAITGCGASGKMSRRSSPSAAPKDGGTKVIYAGDSVVLTPTGGVAPFTYNSSISGYLDTTTGAYAVPTNAALSTETVTMTDANGDDYSMTVRLAGFTQKSSSHLSQGSAYYNWPTDVVWLANGTILVSELTYDYRERWVVLKSTDQGATWSTSDHYLGSSYNRETHVYSLAASGANVFACGFSWGAGSATEASDIWEIRRSTDSGNTWTSVDSYHNNQVGGQAYYYCLDVAVAPSTGYVYAVGYSHDPGGSYQWTVRESRDNGDSWTTIYNGTPIAGNAWQKADQVDVTPNGQVIVVGESGSGAGSVVSIRGQFDAMSSSWNWSNSITQPAESVRSENESNGGTLLVVSNTDAYFGFENNTYPGTGKIWKTTDAGDHWSEVYSGNVFIQGLVKTASGDIIANAGDDFATDWQMLRSTNNGASWSATSLKTQFGIGALDPFGIGLANQPGTDKVFAVSSNWSSEGPVTTAASTDSGVSWTQKGDLTFLWGFYDDFRKIVRVSASELLATTDSMMKTSSWYGAWEILRSTDNGNTWSAVKDSSPVKGRTDDLIKGHDGAYYSVGTLNNMATKIYRSTDRTTWTEVYSDGTLGNNNSFMLNYGTSTLVFNANQSGQTIKVYSSNNGTVWTPVGTLNTPTNSWNFKGVTKDSSGNLYAFIIESAASYTPVIFKSTDGGATWNELYRAASSANAGTAQFKIYNDVLYLSSDTSLTSSVDGVTWNAVGPVITDVTSDFALINNKMFIYANHAGRYDIETINDSNSSWIIVENYRARDLTALGTYNQDPLGFLELSSSEIYMNATRTDFNYGDMGTLLQLTTSP